MNSNTPEVNVQAMRAVLAVMDDAMFSLCPQRRLFARPLVPGEPLTDDGDTLVPLLDNGAGEVVLANVVILDRARPGTRMGFYLRPVEVFPDTEKAVLRFMRRRGFPI